MSKSIAKYPEDQRRRVIERRLKNRTFGNGYWAAVRAAIKLNIPLPKEAQERIARSQS